MRSETKFTPFGGATCSGILTHTTVEGTRSSGTSVEGARSSRTERMEVDTGTCTSVEGEE
jgi:hypothetical protein